MQDQDRPLWNTETRKETNVMDRDSWIDQKATIGVSLGVVSVMMNVVCIIFIFVLANN